jgi:Bacterial Ig-like domain
MPTRRFLLIFVLSPVLIVFGAVATWAYWTTSGAGTANANTGTINAPTAVTASNTPTSPLVVVSWTNSAPAAGLSPSGYYVSRIRNSDGATFDACGSSAASPTATTPCNDTSVPDDTYHYVVTGVLATWTATSASSNNVTIDTTAPTVTGVSSTLADGRYKAGQVIPVTVTFSENVTVTGTPQLTLSTGSPSTTAVDYASGSSTSVLTFNYTVVAGNTSPDLDYAATTSLALNGGTIQDLAANIATLTLASPGAAGSLGASKSLVIDTTAPVVSVTSVNGSVRTFPYSTNANVASIGGTCGSATGDSATVSPLINGVATAPATATCSSGAWTLALTTALTSEASYALSATQADTAGNTGSATSQTVTIDKTAPTLGISSCAGGTSQNTVAGTTNDNGTTVSVKILVGTGTGGTLFTTLTSPMPSAGSWSVTTAVHQLDAGTTYTAQAKQIDSAGNTSNQPTCTFTAN